MDCKTGKNCCENVIDLLSLKKKTQQKTYQNFTGFDLFSNFFSYWFCRSSCTIKQDWNHLKIA